MIGDEEIQAVVRTLRSGILTQKDGGGPNVVSFEKSFASFVGAKHAVAVSSGTAALHAALLAAGVGQGDEVILPSFSFVAPAEAVALVGARPIFVDIDPGTYTIDPDLVRRAMTKRTRAIIAVDLYGLPCDLSPLLETAADNEMILIEDAAQAHGAVYEGRRVGGIADVTCFSFFATKNMTTGEGGMATTDDDELAEKLRMIRNHGEKAPWRTVTLGHNYRMNEIQAAIGIVQLSRLPRFLKRRGENAAALTRGLSDIDGVQLPMEPSGRGHSWHVYTIRASGGRDNLVEGLNERGIGATVYYRIPVHLMPYHMTRFGCGKGMLPKTEIAAREVLSLPVHPGVSRDDIEHICETLSRFDTQPL